jgi:hypothetical protein
MMRRRSLRSQMTSFLSWRKRRRSWRRSWRNSKHAASGPSSLHSV